MNPLGVEDLGGAGYHFVRSPFGLCLNCGVSYGGRERSDYGKLASLTSEGRSTATTILSLSTIRALRADKHTGTRARKLLSFTDNRQDASLQAGHFNDFIEVGLLRGRPLPGGCGCRQRGDQPRGVGAAGLRRAGTADGTVRH